MTTTSSTSTPTRRKAKPRAKRPKPKRETAVGQTEAYLLTLCDELTAHGDARMAFIAEVQRDVAARFQAWSLAQNKIVTDAQGILAGIKDKLVDFSRVRARLVPQYNDRRSVKDLARDGAEFLDLEEPPVLEEVLAIVGDEVFNMGGEAMAIDAENLQEPGQEPGGNDG